ncbi:DMT family transporter [Flaviaesturariibacter aridisoli]|uniref:Drug/metabolite-transporting permease n=1 Tax=Flaviaesturariibacter aridisoli TaxID=2545761 RepID=A0A4R4DV64_9BACT|nr:EamA family transporter [Flaviaesturariibacter aridisoli]TCZ67216.1 drug/metabolite-transporting permease [Flaviaesturariibacter aridisoli]
MEKHPPQDAFTPADPQTTQDLAWWHPSRLNPFTFHKRGRRFKALFALATICFFWGTTWIAARQGVKYMPALQLAGLRQLFAGLCLVGYFVAKRAPWPTAAQWRTIAMLGFLNFFLSNALSTWGVRFIPAGLGSIIGAIYPVWLVLIGLATRSVLLTWKTALGMLLGFGGICIIFYEHLHELVNPAFRLGILLSVASTWSWAFGTLYTKKHAANFNPYFSFGLQLVLSGSVLLAGMKATGNSMPLADIPWQSWAAIWYLVFFGSVITFAAFLYALQNLPTTQVSLYAYINPVVAVLLGALLIGEPLSLFIGVGTAVTLYGVFLVNRSISRK